MRKVRILGVVLLALGVGVATASIVGTTSSSTGTAFYTSASFQTITTNDWPNVALDIAPVTLINVSRQPITLLKAVPAGLSSNAIKVSQGFVANLCAEPRFPAVPISTPNLIHLYRVRVSSRPIQFVPSSHGYCCTGRGEFRLGCGYISSPYYPVDTVRIASTGTYSIQGFEVTYLSGGTQYHEFLKQVLVVHVRSSSTRP
jgi:hypothetical protein